ALSATTGIAPADITATVSDSDPDGSIAATSIDFGDGTVANGTAAMHAYSTPGTYTVKARATDNLGAVSFAIGTVVISANQPPVPRLSLTPASGVAPLLVTASTAASTDADGTVKSSTINFGDGSALVAGFNASHTYSSAGTYTVTATVTDDRGATSQTA